MCQLREVQAFMQDPVVAQLALFTHNECLEKLNQRYDRSQKLQLYDPTFEELSLRTSPKTSFENSVTCEDLELPNQ